MNEEKKNIIVIEEKKQIKKIQTNQNKSINIFIIH